MYFYISMEYIFIFLRNTFLFLQYNILTTRLNQLFLTWIKRQIIKIKIYNMKQEIVIAWNRTFVESNIYYSLYRMLALLQTKERIKRDEENEMLHTAFLSVENRTQAASKQSKEEWPVVSFCERVSSFGRYTMAMCKGRKKESFAKLPCCSLGTAWRHRCWKLQGLVYYFMFRSSR